MYSSILAPTIAGIFCLAPIGLMLSQRRKPKDVAQFQSNPGASPPIFLFHGRDLVDATPQALEVIASYCDHLDERDAMLQVLGPQFPQLGAVLGDPPKEKLRINGIGTEELWLEVSQNADILRVAIHGATDIGSSNTIAHDVQLSELAMLRDVIQHNPQLVWHENNEGKLTWANHAYLKLVDLTHPPAANETSVWPPVSLFPSLHAMPLVQNAVVHRLPVTAGKQNGEYWFDVTTIPYDSGRLHFATDANAVVCAEQERRNFVQTLGKTFAELSTGIAIFDKRRELAMFNPAMLDMTGLQVDFLSSRPTLDDVLDKLRELRMLSEPKNYASWRDQFQAVETAAKNGTFCETWALPGGQTFRVTGRPHPDGAFAFLFEDISAELSLTRRFRTDIKTSQSVLDALPEAVAVFTSAGDMVMSNRAYAQLWQTNPAVYHEQRALRTELKVWQERCTTTPIWGKIRDFAHQNESREAWADTTFLDDGRQLHCHASPIAGGKTLVRFVPTMHSPPVIQKLSMYDPALRGAKR